MKVVELIRVKIARLKHLPVLIARDLIHYITFAIIAVVVIAVKKIFSGVSLNFANMIVTMMHAQVGRTVLIAIGIVIVNQIDAVGKNVKRRRLFAQSFIILVF